jgi:hypothetical protein
VVPNLLTNGGDLITVCIKVMVHLGAQGYSAYFSRLVADAALEGKILYKMLA